MFPFNLFHSIPPDVVMSIQRGAAMTFYYAIVLAAASLALLITYDQLHAPFKESEDD